MMSPIEKLPNEVIGKILVNLVQISGSKGIANKADIPFIMKSMRSLACTNTRFYTDLNEPQVVKVFVEALADRYKESPQHFAAELNTSGAREYIWKYIHEKKYDQDYESIQEVHELAASTSKIAKDAGIYFEYTEGREGWPDPNPFYSQTKQGFYLSIDSAPSELFTPFGKVMIFGGGSSQGYATYSVSEFFIKNLDARFECLTGGGFGSNGGELYEIETSTSNAIRDLTEQEIRPLEEVKLNEKKGTSNLINHTLCGRCSIYKIQKIGDRDLPEPQMQSRDSMLSYGLVNLMWELLEKKRKGEDPLAKVVKAKKTKTEIIPSQFSCLSSVASWVIDAVRNLDSQPVLKGITFSGCGSKVLVLKDYSEARFLELINSAASRFLSKEDIWQMSAFGCGNHRININEKDIGEGIQLFLSEKKNYCSVEDLEKAYKNVFKELRINWQPARLEDYPDILHTESEEEYFLFVKQKNLKFSQEDALMRILARNIGLSNFIKCNDGFKGDSPKDSKPIYMWIGKDKIDKVVEALELIVELPK